MMVNYLLCSDLDRTILPNGPQDESSAARPLLHRLAALPQVKLAYVSGRHRELLLEAIADYDIPMPDFAIGDVGTTIYEIEGSRWQPSAHWSQKLGENWQGRTSAELHELFTDIRFLTLQEQEKQNTHKLSYYTPEAIDREGLFALLNERLAALGLEASLVWSVDEMAHVGLLDILPRAADKLQAIRFLMADKGFSDKYAVFAGDSGNDISVLTSGMQGILVRNARDEVRQEIERYLAATDQLDRLYLARGGFAGMNGNYAAGVIEGFCHFFPELSGMVTDPAANPI